MDISVSGSDVGKAKPAEEQTPARFPVGTFGRIASVLEDGESRAEFIREAVEREIKRRSRAKPEKP